MKVKEVMLDPITIEPDATVIETIKKMYDKGFGSMIIVDENKKLVGIITERDIVWFLAKNENIRAQINKIMTKKVICVSSSDTLNDAAELMKENKIKRLPVTERGKVVGVITADVLIQNKDSLDEPFLF